MTEKIVMSNKVYEALHEAGVVDEDPMNVERCMIVLKTGEPAKAIIHRYLRESITETLIESVKE